MSVEVYVLLRVPGARRLVILRATATFALSRQLVNVLRGFNYQTSTS